MDPVIEEIKVIQRENAIAIKELRMLQKETEATLKAMFEETDREFKETDKKFKETDEKFQNTDKQINKVMGQFTTIWGKLVESLVEGDLIKILQARGIKVHDTAQRRKGNHEGRSFEFDIVARNGIEIVIVEVKTTLTVSDVKEFLAKLPFAHIWMDEYKNHSIYGAVAFIAADGSADAFAENNGLFVIRATGNSASIINAPEFVPVKY